MREAGSIQFEARPAIGEPTAISFWSDVTVSAADGGVRVVALDFARVKASTSSASLVDDAAATIAAHGGVVGSTAAALPTDATASRDASAGAAGRAPATVGKPSATSAPDATHAESERVLAFAIALSPPPSAIEIEIEAESAPPEAPSVTRLDTAPPSAFLDRAVDTDSPLP
jgi:hypothetical protein